MKKLLPELDGIIRSIKVRSSTAYSFKGQLYSAASQYEDIMTNDSGLNNYVVLQLQLMLYRLFHCRQSMFFDPEPQYISSYSDIQDFTSMLSQANMGSGSSESGWEIRKLEVEGQRIEVYKDGLTLWVLPEQFTVHDEIIGLGKKGSIKMPKEFCELLPGFYMAIGNAPLEQHDEKIIITRLYWNIIGSYASSLVRYITSELNALNLPFRFKILKNPHHFPRSDAAVLYINKQNLEKSRKAFSRVYQQVRTLLNYPTPFLAKRLAPGIALAEDPQNSESFGQHRCRILAEAIYNAYKKGLSSHDEITGEIDRYFEDQKLNLNRPYLNSSSEDDYDLLLQGAFNSYE